MFFVFLINIPIEIIVIKTKEYLITDIIKNNSAIKSKVRGKDVC